MSKRASVVGLVQKPDPETLLAMLKQFRKQAGEIEKQFARGEINNNHVQALIDHRNPFTTQVSLADAIAILGRAKVATFKQAVRAWSWESRVREIDVPTWIPYAKSTLVRAVTANRTQNTDWRLVFVHGFSIYEQQQFSGASHFFCGEWTSDWTRIQPTAGYYLINFVPKFLGMTWEEQESNIGLWEGAARAHEAMVTEATITFSQLSGGKDMPFDLPKVHWGNADGNEPGTKRAVDWGGRGSFMFPSERMDCLIEDEETHQMRRDLDADERGAIVYIKPGEQVTTE